MIAALDPPVVSPETTVRRQIPSLRNRDVYAAVAAGKSHADVGTQFGLTQPRVTQIVRQVREWCTQETRGDGSDFTDIQRLRLAEHTLEIQYDAWMRMAMGQWWKSCQEGLGKPVFLNAASRLSANLARLAGVDVSGKTARLKAEQQAQAEAELRAQRQAQKAEEPLWPAEQETAHRTQAEARPPAPTLAPDTVCDERAEEQPASLSPAAVRKNSYDLIDLSAARSAADSIKQRLSPPPPAPLPAAHAKPIPKFLDKKVRKRLLALRRQEARGTALANVG